MSTYLNALEFLAEEMLRFSQMDIEQLKKLSLEDHLATIPDPNGHGSMLCGVTAYRRLEDAAELAVARAGYAGRIKASKVLRILIDGIAESFFQQKHELNLSTADKLFSNSVKEAAKAIGPRTHFIPCMISDDEGPDDFHIGPIHFQRRKLCLEKLSTLFAQYCASGKPGRDDKSVSLALTYYKAFDWIAEITIDDADPESSREIARNAVSSALNFLHVLIGTRFSSHLRVEGPSPKLETLGRFEVCDGKISYLGITRSWPSRSLGEGWWGYLNAGAAHVLPTIGKVIENSLTHTPSPLVRRLMDAAHWYGDASRERFPASQVVKFVTAIERILVIGKEDNLTKTFCVRGGVLTSYPDKSKVLRQCRRFARVYNARSRFVHGSSSPFDAKFLKALPEAEELSRAVLWSALEFFNQGDCLTDQTMTDARLGKGFDALVAWSTAPTAASEIQHKESAPE